MRRRMEDNEEEREKEDEEEDHSRVCFLLTSSLRLYRPPYRWILVNEMVSS